MDAIMSEIRPFVALVLITLVAVGCAQPSSNVTPSHDAGARSTLTPVGGLEWSASADAISYLEPETDNVWITLGCQPHSGRIRIDEPLRDQPTSTINLVSGDIAETYPAT